MARKKNKQTKRKNAQQPMPRRRGLSGPRALLDNSARAYARLLADPCNAPLTHSTYPGAGGTVVTRFESDFIVASGATEQAFVCMFTPGVFGTTNVVGEPGMVMCAAGALTSDTDTISWANFANRAPGQTFLNPTAKCFRSIAACIQVSWPGSELNRQGIVGMTQTTMSLAYSGNTETTGNLRAMCSHVGRMPAEVMELRLRPTDASFRFNDTAQPFTVVTGQTTFGDQPSLLVTVSGFPVSTGVRLRLVNVVEWMPNVSSGIINPDSSYNASRSSTQDVLRTLQNINWFSVGANAGRMLGGMASGYTTARASRAMRLEL